MRKFILINSRLERAHFSQCSAVQCSTIKNYKYVKQQMILFPITRNSSRVRQPLWVSRENVTALLRWLQDLFHIKIENIFLFKLIKKNMETSLKTGFAQIFSCCPKNLSCPKLGGAAAPLAPPARTPMWVRAMIIDLFRKYHCRFANQDEMKFEMLFWRFDESAGVPEQGPTSQALVNVAPKSSE